MKTIMTLLACFIQLSIFCEGLPRTLIALYDGEISDDIFVTKIHQLVEMPLNHLGLKLQYYDVTKELPEIHNDPDVLGIITWYDKGVVIPNSEKYLEWLIQAIEAKKKYVMIGRPGFDLDNLQDINRLKWKLWNLLGLRDRESVVADTYNVKLNIHDPFMIGFEKTHFGFKHPFPNMSVVDDNVEVFLSAQYNEGDEVFNIPMITHGENGAYLVDEYTRYVDYVGPKLFMKWYINPFRFFEKVFSLKGRPIPDTTTLAGRRIFYSHVDGSGWNDPTELEGYSREKKLSSEVIYSEILSKHPELPFAVSPIVADLKADWISKSESVPIAKKIFALDNVEAGVHSYSHPYIWGFFSDYSKDKELQYLSSYKDGSWKRISISETLKSKWVESEAIKEHKKRYKILQSTPRAYAKLPFDLELETKGAADEITKLLPEEKKVVLYEWTGDYRPFEAAVKATRNLGLSNLNGGKTRFDREFDSYAWVKPLGRQVGDERQVYSSASNEIPYTHGWKTKFYGYSLLPETWDKTDSPIRVKPINLWFQVLSGQKLSSLSALKKNIAYLKTKEFIPIFPTHFVKIVDGFFTTKLEISGDHAWKIYDRGALQTIRFDHSVFKGVDFTKSHGIVGQRHLQGSLYVYLDKDIDIPEIVLKETEVSKSEPIDADPFLLESSWEVWDVKRSGKEKFTFKAGGFDQGQMRWMILDDGEYQVTVNDKDRVVDAKKGHLDLVFDKNATIDVKVEKVR